MHEHLQVCHQYGKGKDEVLASAGKNLGAPGGREGGGDELAVEGVPAEGSRFRASGVRLQVTTVDFAMTTYPRTHPGAGALSSVYFLLRSSLPMTLATVSSKTQFWNPSSDHAELGLWTNKTSPVIP